MIVHYISGSGRNTEEQQQCDSIEEGDSGIILKDSTGDQTGYIPFDNLMYAVPQDN